MIVDKPTTIRMTSHSVRFANTGKKSILAEFRKEYANVVRWTVDYLWNNSFDFGGRTLSIAEGKLDVPSFILS